MTTLRRGLIIDVDLEPIKGSETGKTRPCIIVTNNIATAKAVKTEEEDNRAILNQPQNDGKSIQLRFTPKSGAGN